MKNQATTNVARMASTIQQLAGLVLVLTGMLFLPGCGPEAKPSVVNKPAGVYVLVAVNGNKLPATIKHDGVELQIRSGAFTFNADSTCSSKMTFVPPSGTETTREVAATYRKEGTTLHMQWTGAGNTTGTLKGNTLTMDNEGMSLLYQK